MDSIAALRLALTCSHLLLCVFALHCVLSTDWRLLRARLSARRLEAIHRRVIWLLLGLVVSGALMAGADVGFDFAQLSLRPKLLTKLVCVTMLTLNGVLLRVWCLPRLTSRRALGRVEAMALMACGATSTASWLMAAFFGIARPLQTAGLAQCMTLYLAALAAALLAGVLLHGRLVRDEPARAGALTPGPAAPVAADATPGPGLLEAGAG